MNWACTSVGTPGYGSAETSIGRNASGASDTDRVGFGFDGQSGPIEFRKHRSEVLGRNAGYLYVAAGNSRRQQQRGRFDPIGNDRVGTAGESFDAQDLQAWTCRGRRSAPS